MILSLCEQQPAIAAIFHRRCDLLHFECSPLEWQILEDVAELLQPFKVATEYLGREKYPMISALVPLLAEIRAKIEFAEDDIPTICEVKKVRATDMHTRYQDRRVTEVLNISLFLNPWFKTLAHLTKDVQEKTVDSLKEGMLGNLEVITSSSLTSAKVESADPPVTKRKKLLALQKLLRTKF